MQAAALHQIRFVLLGEPAVLLGHLEKFRAGIRRGERNLQAEHVEFLRKIDRVLDALRRLDGQPQNERPMNHHVRLVAGLGEAAHLVHCHAFFDARENVVVAALVTDEEQAEAVVLERFYRVIIQVRTAVAAPMHAERRELLGDFAGAREVRGERVVVEEKFAHLRENFLHVGHLVRDVLRRTDAILVAADGLRPEAERTLRRAATSRIHRDVGMQQIADEIFFNLQIAFIDVRDPRERVHVLDHFALGIVDDLAVLVFVGKPGDAREVAVFGDFLAGEIKFLAAHPVNRRRRLQRFRWQHHRMRTDETDLRVRLLRLDGLGHLAVVFQRRRGGVDDDVIEILRDGEGFRHADVVRRAVEQLGVWHERGGLREPGRIPIAGDFAPRLIPRARAAVETVERRR